MLRKIDCVMIRVPDVEAAAAYYAKVFGLRPIWSGDNSIGLVFAESDTESVFTAIQIFPLQSKSIIWSTMSLRRQIISQHKVATYYARLFMVPNGAHFASAADFKTPVRAEIERLGYTIIANMGDQPSDLRGGHAEKKFLLANPFYRVP